MKYAVTVLVTIVLVVQGFQLKAQLSQNKKQTRYLIQQIAANQVYIGYLKSGYNIVKSGINTIRQIKDGEFSVHDVYYASLKTVNPRLREHPQARTILENHQFIVTSAERLVKAASSNHYLPLAQQEMIRLVCKKLLEDVSVTTDELRRLLASGQYQMTDDQRLARLQEMYDYSVRQMVFIKRLSGDVLVLQTGARQDERDDRQLRGLYDLKNGRP